MEVVKTKSVDSQLSKQKSEDQVSGNTSRQGSEDLVETESISKGSKSQKHGNIDADEPLALAEFLASHLSTNMETVVMPKLFAKQLEALTASIKETLKQECPSHRPGRRSQQFTSPRAIMRHVTDPAHESASTLGGSSSFISNAVSVAGSTSYDPSECSSFVVRNNVEPGTSQGPRLSQGSQRSSGDMASFPLAPFPLELGTEPERPKTARRDRRVSTVEDLQSEMSSLLLSSLRIPSKDKTPDLSPSPSLGSFTANFANVDMALVQSVSPRRPSITSLGMPNVPEGEPSQMDPSPYMSSVPERSASSGSHDSVCPRPSTRYGSAASAASFTDMTSLRHRTSKIVVESDISEPMSMLSRKIDCNYLWVPLRMCGFVPWHDLSLHPNKLKGTLCLCYQWLILGIAFLGCVTSILPIAQGPSDQSAEPLCYSHTTCLRTGLFCDLAIAFGSLFGLISLAAHRNSLLLRQCLHLLRSYASREDFEERWHQLTLWEVLGAVLLWLVVAVERMRGTEFIQAVLDGGVDGLTVLHTVVFTSSSLLLVALTYLVLHMTHGLASAVDAFCSRVFNTGDLDQGIHRWNVVVAILREVVGGIQSCLFVLQATVLFMFMLGAVDFYLSEQQTDGRSYASLLFPHVLLIFGISRVFFKAAAVTEKCARVPSLINACDFGHPFDEKRQYVVQYVEQSAAGFYVRDIRLTSAMTVKFAYVCILGLFTLATKIVSNVTIE